MTEAHVATASGKIILSGEYAVVFGKRGIAMPSKERMTVSWTDEPKPVEIFLDANKRWIDYARNILTLLNVLNGTVTIDCELPLGKGMGSSTALVIALARCFLGPACKEKALEIENIVNPGHSGIDFAVIWEGKPVLFKKDTTPQAIDLVLPGNAKLIDTGAPNETTQELVAWVKNQPDIAGPIETIGECTERILKGEDLKTVMRDHHGAQVALGVVPEAAQKLIAEIEKKGGAAKVLGAGARTGGGGMVLVFPA